MNNKGLVSIIMPVYNTEKYVVESIKSVLKQTYENIELVVINDGSKDNSEKVILELQANDSRIKYQYQENMGVSKARNHALKISNGEFIAFLDSDDLYDNQFIEKMVHQIAENDVCYCGHFTQDEYKVLRKSKILFTSENVVEGYFYNKTTPHTNSWLIRKSVIDHNKLVFEDQLNWGEDMLFFSKILTLSNGITYCPEHLTIYNVGRNDSLSINSLNKIDKDILWLDMYIEFLSNTNLDLTKKKAIISSIEGYRLPAAIIYRMYNNVQEVDGPFFNKYKDRIDKFKFNNGLRSVKLFLYKKKLLKKI